jgi:hypothetical protein
VALPNLVKVHRFTRLASLVASEVYPCGVARRDDGQKSTLLFLFPRSSTFERIGDLYDKRELVVSQSKYDAALQVARDMAKGIRPLEASEFYRAVKSLAEGQ